MKKHEKINKHLIIYTILIFIILLLIINSQYLTNENFEKEKLLKKVIEDNANLYSQYLLTNEQYRICLKEKIPQENITTQAEQRCLIPGMGAFKIHCNGEIKYACRGKIVDYKTYMNCECPLQDPECVMR